MYLNTVYSNLCVPYQGSAVNISWALLTFRSHPLQQYTTEKQMVFEAPEKTKELQDDLVKSQAGTLVDAFSWAVTQYRDDPLLGTR